MSEAIVLTKENGGIEFFRLCQLRGAVKMEKIGLKLSKARGRSVRKMAALEIGLKQNATFDEVIAKLEELISAAHAARAAKLSLDQQVRV